MEWQPIETASKNRTLLLGYKNSLGKWRTTRGCWFTKELLEETLDDCDGMPEGWYETPSEGEECYYIEPTHWMPLPKPPQGA